MAIRRRRMGQFVDGVIADSSATGKNEKFVWQRTALYLERLLSKAPQTLDEEALLATCWILGPAKEEIAQLLQNSLRGGLLIEFTEQLEDTSDNDDYARAILNCLSRSNKELFYMLLNKITLLLQKRRTSLSYQGLSDAEKAIRSFTKMFNLSKQEGELLGFLFCVSASNEFETYFVDHLKCGALLKRRYLEIMFQCNKQALNKLLSGKMAQLEMIETGYNYDTLQLADEYLELFTAPDHTSQTKSLYRKVSGKILPLDYHLIDASHKDFLLRLLQTKSDTPTNILLYGSPGTGKTSFAKGLIKESKLNGYEVVQGTDNEGGKRRAAILACLNMTEDDDKSVVLIDEADNILNTISSYFERGETQDKGWLNQLLEKKDTKTIWITNHINLVEESVKRRFAFSLFFRPFNRRQRVQLWSNVIQKNRVKRYFSQKKIHNLADKYKLNAGIIDSAIQKAAQINPTGKKDFINFFELAMDSHYCLLKGEKPKPSKNTIEDCYSLDGLNIKGDIKEIVKQLNHFDTFLRRGDQKKHINMNLLFYGPPGTGKSELARYLAKHLDREIICKKISDLRNMYVGESERLIKEAFEGAEREEAVLVIDEADTLLFSRDRAIRSWEVSFTNEFLTQMEKFRGILVCTTNRLEDLDNASIRRFNHKVGFNYLTPEGNVTFYMKMLYSFVGKPLDEHAKQSLMSISNLSPGDFKIVNNRYCFYKKTELTHRLLINSLTAEAELKNIHNGSKAIGF